MQSSKFNQPLGGNDMPRAGGIATVIEVAGEILPQREAAEHADHGRERHRQQQADEAEQRAEGEQREHQPDRMQADGIADELRRQDVAFEELARGDDAHRGDDGGRVGRAGSDRLGRDQWSRIMHGTQTSMTVGLVAVALSTLLGVLLGGISGYVGGRTDSVIQRLVVNEGPIPVDREGRYSGAISKGRLLSHLRGE